MKMGFLLGCRSMLLLEVQKAHHQATLFIAAQMEGIRVVSLRSARTPNRMKLLIAGLVISLVVGAVTILYFSLARFFAVQNQRRIAAVTETRQKLADSETTARTVTKKKAQAGQ